MLLFGGVFLVIFVVFLVCVGFGQAFLVSRQKNQIRTMLRRAETVAGKRRPDLFKPEVPEDGLTKLLKDLPTFDRVEVLLFQSGLDWTPAKFVILSGIAALLGAVVGYVIPPFSHLAIAPFVLGLLLAGVPFLRVLGARSKRMAKFEEQFPEALNFLSRSMRAGHAFSIGLEMLVADSAEPLSSVLRQMLNDIHLGSSLETALEKLSDAVPLVDVRFFVSAVLLQQGTGGNLSEILDTMAKIIRERFKLKGQINAASAHGRVTGLILAVMPVIVALMLFVVSPQYLMVLFTDPLGKDLLIAAAIGQMIGFLCIRSIVNIKV